MPLRQRTKNESPAVFRRLLQCIAGFNKIPRRGLDDIIRRVPVLADFNGNKSRLCPLICLDVSCEDPDTPYPAQRLPSQPVISHPAGHFRPDPKLIQMIAYVKRSAPEV